MMPVMTPVGRCDRHDVLGHQVGAQHDDRADQAGRDDAAAAVTDEPLRDRAGDEGDEHDRAGDRRGEADQDDRDRDERQPAQLDARTERLRGVVTQLEDAQRPLQQQRDRHEDHQRDEQRAQLGRTGLAHRADEPGHGLPRLVELGVRDDVADDRDHELRQPDADQDEPVARDAVAPGQQIDQQRTDQRAREGRGGDHRAARAEQDDRGHREQARARRDAHEVRRRERVAEQLLEQHPRDARARTRRPAPRSRWAAAGRAR